MKAREHKKVTLRDIAKAGNLSMAAVSMALSNHEQISTKTKRNVLRLCRQYGYRPPRERLNGRSVAAGIRRIKRIGFILMEGSLQDEVYEMMLQHLSTSVIALGLRMEMACVDRNTSLEEELRQLSIFAGGVDGVIICGRITRALLVMLQEELIPTLIIGQIKSHDDDASQDPQTHIVDCDYLNIGRTAVGYLARQGHTRIGFLCEELLPGMCHARWLAGYKLGLVDNDLPLDPRWIHVAGKVYAGAETAARAFSSMTDSPTGFVIPDVRIADSFVRSMSALGRGCELNQLVIGGHSKVAQKHGLENFPLLEQPGDLLAEMDIRQLLMIAESPPPCSTQLYIPHNAINMT